MASKNNSVTLLRVVSTVLILLTHTIQYYTFLPGHGVLNQVFTVGTLVFFLISGYLYGQKRVSGFGKWYLGRWKRVAMPIIPLALIVFAALLPTTDRVSFTQVIPYFFCAQGLPFICYKLFSSFIREIPQLGPLWFATVIMICYALVPLFGRLRDALLPARHGRLIGAVIACGLLLGAAALASFTDLALNTFVTFFIGYLLGAFAFGEKRMPVWFMLLASLLMLGMQGGRLVLHHFMDDTPLYRGFVILSGNALALWILFLFFFINQRLPRFTEKLAGCAAVSWFDKLSFYVYLTHGIFCTGSAFNMYTLIPNVWLATLCFILAASATTVALYWLHKGLLRVIEPKKKLKQ